MKAHEVDMLAQFQYSGSPVPRTFQVVLLLMEEGVEMSKLRSHAVVAGRSRQ